MEQRLPSAGLFVRNFVFERLGVDYSEDMVFTILHLEIFADHFSDRLTFASPQEETTKLILTKRSYPDDPSDLEAVGIPMANSMLYLNQGADPRISIKYGATVLKGLIARYYNSNSLHGNEHGFFIIDVKKPGTS